MERKAKEEITKPKIKSLELVKAKQAQICRAAEELFAEKGYHKTSIRDIANKSGISIGSLYDYIRNKEDILYLLANEFYNNLREEVIKVTNGDNDPLHDLEGTLETMLRVVDRFQEYTLFTYRDSQYLKKGDLIDIIEQESFFNKTFTEIINKGIEQNVLETKEPEIISNMLTILTHSWALKRYNLKKYPFYLFQKVFIQFVLHGLMKRNRNDT
jgi:AcrR family transcriptional regulator